MLALGVDPAFAADVLGDLAEEHARHEECGGVLAAWCWYALEAGRTTPHLLWNAARHGGVRGRSRVAALSMMLALVPAVGVMVWQMRDGPPVLLTMEGRGDLSDGIVVNTRKPVQLAMRASDAKGHVLPASDVRYRWVSGTRVPVSPGGVVRCTMPGDAVLQTSIGSLATAVLVRCRPVRDVGFAERLEFVVGDSARAPYFQALDFHGRPVNRPTAELRIEDSTIATLRGGRIQPLAPGWTRVSLRVGDDESETEIDVYEPVRVLAPLRKEQRFVIAPVRVPPGEVVRLTLPFGRFWLEYRPGSPDQTVPAMAVEGRINCMPTFGPESPYVGCVVREPGASLRITNPVGSSREIVGRLALEQERVP